MRRLLPILFISMTTLLFISCGNEGPAERNPMISEIQPKSGPPGTSVTIAGSDFSPTISENAVTFDGASADIQEAEESQLVAAVPDSAETGPVEVVVDGNIASGPQFTVESEAPGISLVEPSSGTVGTEVTISGMNFSTSASENTITFDGTDAPVNGAAEDQLLTEVPQGASDGPIEVSVEGETTTGPDFDVITEGALEANISTSGDDQDDSYELTVDGETKNTDANDTIYFTDLEEGIYKAELSDMADNCSVDGNNPRSLDVSAGDTTSATFDLSCKAVANNMIGFHSSRDGNYQVYLMNADGSNPEQLTSNSIGDGIVAISNNGSKIAFTSLRNGNEDLYTMNVDGSNVEQLTSTSAISGYPSWSPDDSKIAFTDYRNNVPEIYVINADGSGEVRLTNNSSNDAFPSWSPSGNKIAFTSDRDGDEEIFTMKTDGTDFQQVTTDTDNNFGVRWSPDGNQFVFVSDRDGDDEIYIMNTDGTGLKQLTNNSSDDGEPSWSPDGSEVVFESHRDGNAEIYKMNADGTGTPTNLTVNNAEDLFPFWSPVE